MARIEGVSISNYRVLKSVILGRVLYEVPLKPLTSLTAVIGKSCLLDASGFSSIA